MIGGSCHKYNFCRDKSFVAIKHVFAATNTCLLRQNTSFVATKLCLSRQKYVHAFFIFLSGNKHTFVATKMILIAAPANDRVHGQ